MSDNIRDYKYLKMYKFRISLIVSLFCCIIISSQKQQLKLHSGSLVHLNCSTQTLLNFKVMQLFTIVLKNAPSQAQIQLKTYKNNPKVADTSQQKTQICQLNKQNQICNFNNFTTKIWASCNENIVSEFISLEVIEPIIFYELQQTELITGRVLMPLINYGKRGVLILQTQNNINFLQINQQLSISNSYEVNDENIRSTGCVKLLQYHHNLIYVGIANNNNSQCIIYLGQYNHTIKKYQITQNHFELQKNYQDYIIKQQRRSYRGTQLYSFLISINKEQTQIDEICQSNSKGIILSFIMQNNTKIQSLDQISQQKTRKIDYNLCQFIKEYTDSHTYEIFVNLNRYEELIFQSTISISYSIKFLRQKDTPIIPQILLYQLFKAKQLQNIVFEYDLPVSIQNSKYHIQCTTNVTKIQDISDNKQSVINLDNNHDFNLQKVFPEMKYRKLKIFVKTNSTFLFSILPKILKQTIKAQNNIYSQVLPKQTKIFQIQGSQLSKIPSDKLALRLDFTTTIKPLMMEIQFFATYNVNCQKISCCEFTSSNNFMSIPNSKKLMKIFIVSYEQEQNINFNFIVDRLDQHNYILAPGIINKMNISQNNPLQHYIFISDSAQMSLVCNSNSNSLILMINTKKKSFPTFKDFEYQSNNCFLTFKSVIGSKIYLTIYYDKYEPSQTKFTNSAVLYDLVITSILQPIRLIWNTPFYDFIDIESQKTYKIILNSQNINNNTYLKIQKLNDDKLMNISMIIMEQSTLKSRSTKLDVQKMQLQFSEQIYLRRKQDIFQTVNLGTVSKKICKNIQLCSILLIINNQNKNKGYSVSVTIWHQKQVFELQLGNFFTSQLFYPIIPQKQHSNERDLYFFCRINSQYKTHVYIQGSGFVFDVSYALLASSTSQKNLLKLLRHGEMFPKIDINKIFPESYKNFCINNSFKSQENLLLITLRPITNASSLLDKSTFYHFKILCTQQETRMLPGNFFLELKNNQIHKYHIEKIKYQPKSYVNYFINLYSNSDSNELSLHLMAYNGQIQILAYIANTHGIISHTNISLFKSLKNSSLLLQFDQLIEQYFTKKQAIKDTNKIKEKSQVMITISVKCMSLSCSILSTLLSSSTIYKEILPGIQSIFHMKKHSKAIYVFRNFKDLPFKIKINRKQGFPSYRLCSAHIMKMQDCLNELTQNKDSESIYLQLDNQDAQLLEITGRSHELEIDYSSKKYCSSCLYFIGLYSKYDILQGSLFILQEGSPVKLPQGTSITTIAYRNSPDYYSVYAIQQVSLFQHEGEVKISLVNVHSNEILGQFQNNSSSLIQITELKDLCFNPKVQCMFKVEPNQLFSSCLYTIAMTELTQQIFRLADGVPLSFDDRKSIKRKFVFHPETLGSIIITTNKGIITNLHIQLECIGTQTQKTNLKSILQKFTGKQISKGNYSILGNRYQVPINVPPNICSDYQVTILNSKIMDYTVIGQSADFVILTLGQQVVGLLQYQQKLYQIYEIMVTQRKQLQFNIKFCQSSSGRIMIADSKKSMLEQNYVFSMQISQHTQIEKFKYTASPGVFYLTVYFKDRSGIIQYTLKVDDQQRIVQYTATLLNNYIQYETIQIKENQTQFAILFYPCQIVQPFTQTSQQYSVSYYILQSFKPETLKAVSSCNGKHFTQLFKRNQLIGRPIKIHTTYSNQTQNVSKIRVNFTTNYPYSYITIIPVVIPNNLYFSYFPKYVTTQLKNGQVLAAFIAELNRIIYLVKQYFQDYNLSQTTILNIIISLFLVFLSFLCGLIVCMRRKFCPKKQTIFVMKQVSAEQLPGQQLVDTENQQINSNQI